MLEASRDADSSVDIPTFLLKLGISDPLGRLATETAENPSESSGNHCDEPCGEYVETILDLSDDTADQLFATLPDPTKTDPMFQPVTEEEEDLVTVQLSDLSARPCIRIVTGRRCRHFSRTTTAFCLVEAPTVIQSSFRTV